MKDKNGDIISRVANIDPALANAWDSFLATVNTSVNTLNTCNSISAPSDSVCNVTNGHRIKLLDFAQQLGLAWNMSKNPLYRDAAYLYADKILQVTPLSSGTEWTMGGRVAAMGILYDWMYPEMDGKYMPGDTRSYRQALAEHIKNTIAATSSKPSDDLAASICATSASGASNLSYGSSLQCVTPVQIEGWNRWESPLKPSVAKEYIMGHAFSAVHAISMGLLAIYDENPQQIMPLLDTAYQHIERGFLKARGAISLDGGHHTGYAYAAINLPERTLLWRNALQIDNASAPLFTPEWQNKLIYPFIYALRGDNSYPARGDDFGLTASSAEIGQFALWAASNGNDGTALSFYKNTILPSRLNSNTMALVWERLYWPVSAYVQESPVANLDKSRYFRMAGQVLMRDKWETADATLIDFKSSNFLSENHQHLDQNSFSLFYKKPLLLDSGMYDEYGSQHWQNYYTRTVAHNTITVFDSRERFKKNGKEYSNDGGQWFRNPTDNQNSVNTLYPTLEELAPNLSEPKHDVYNDGVQRYEYKPAYTFVSANASKAYSKDKMKQDNGFIRNMVFVPEPKFGGKALTVVFDTVRTEGNLKADFLLHPANEPVIGSGAQGLGNGLYQVQFANGGARKLTVRNGGGMLVVQTLLPQDAMVLKVGGVSGSSCSQISPANGSVTGSSSDCRFVTRQRISDAGEFVWRNYPEKLGSNKQTPQEHSTSDIGAWRLEYSMPGTPAVGETQYFLNVMSVAANDNGSGQGAAPAASRIGSDANTEAVLLEDSLVIAFNRGSSDAASLSWSSSNSNLRILATGLKPDTAYSLNVLPSGNSFTYSLKQTTGGAYQSSAQGVISIGM
ncbi:heparinase II/III family protein [Massilia sp. W12]|uniref:heparinase II/III domain-containing protein n=1 Tax=Massilia sp. W12 TaxID=3126507 RepID=UPI0030D03D33